MKNDGDMTRFEDVSIRHVASDTNKFEETVSVVCRSVLTFNPFFPFAVFIENFFFSPQKPSSRLWTWPSQIFVQRLWSSEAMRTNFFLFIPQPHFIYVPLIPFLLPARSLPAVSLVLMHCLPPSLSLTRQYWLNLTQADLITGYDVDGPLTSHALQFSEAHTHTPVCPTWWQTHLRLLGLISNFGHLSPLIFMAGAWLTPARVVWSLCNLFMPASKGKL